MFCSGSRRSSNDAGSGARVFAALCAFAWGLGHAGVAAADTAPVHVPYTAPAGCPDEAAFDAELAKRVVARPEGRAGGDDDPRRLSVRIEKRNGTFEGQLTVAHEGALGTRQVRGADCAAVVRSLAVFVALALAERPKSAPQEVAPSEDEAPPPAPPPLTRREAPRAAITAPPHPAAASTRPAKPALQNVWRFDAGIQAEYSRAGANAFGARVSAEWSRHFASSPIFPALRISWGFSDFDRAVDFGGEIHSRLRTGRAELCGGVLWGRMRNSLCGAFEIGQLAVTSSGLPLTGRAESGWSAGGLLARTRVTIVDPVGVELAVGLFAPFQRAEFTLIEPARQAYRVPAVTFDGQLGIAVSTTWK